VSRATDADGRELLEGVTVPLVTPIDALGHPDPAAVDEQLASLAEAGITKLLLLGTNGEGPAFGASELAEFAAAVTAKWRSRVGGRTVVSVAIFGSSTRQSMRRAEAVLAKGPDALTVPPPHYFHYDVNEVVGFYRDVASLGSPVIVYNAARYTGNPITAPMLQATSQIPGIVGIKDSGGDDALLLAAVKIAQMHQAFGVSQGNERRLAWALEQGASGITPGLANIAPHACAELVAAVRAGKSDAASTLQAQLDALAAMHQIRPGVACMKAALALLGVSNSSPVPPMRVYSATEMAALRALLASVPIRLIGNRPLSAPHAG